MKREATFPYDWELSADREGAEGAALNQAYPQGNEVQTKTNAFVGFVPHFLMSTRSLMVFSTVADRLSSITKIEPVNSVCNLKLRHHGDKEREYIKGRKRNSGIPKLPLPDPLMEFHAQVYLKVQPRKCDDLCTKRFVSELFLGKVHWNRHPCIEEWHSSPKGLFVDPTAEQQKASAQASFGETLSNLGEPFPDLLEGLHECNLIHRLKPVRLGRRRIVSTEGRLGGSRTLRVREGPDPVEHSVRDEG